MNGRLRCPLARSNVSYFARVYDYSCAYRRLWYYFFMSAKYKKLVASLQAKGSRDPRALAAYIGRKKLGKAEFQKRAAAGRRRAK